MQMHTKPVQNQTKSQLYLNYEILKSMSLNIQGIDIELLCEVNIQNNLMKSYLYNISLPFMGFYFRLTEEQCQVPSIKNKGQSFSIHIFPK